MFLATAFRIALAAIAIHIVDDNWLQPEPGTSATDHLASGLIPLALIGLAAWAYPRLRGGWRGALALASGILGIAAGLEAVHYTRAIGASGDDFTGLLALPAALALLGIGAAELWRTRRTEGSLWWRYPRRALIAGAAFVPTFMVVVAGLGYVTTHAGRAVVPADRLGVAHEDVSFTTADGLELRGWYVPSRNGAAVISFPGRSGSQKQARMLARHGYGVLLFDRRGEGESEGDPNSWGWGGDADVKAAIEYLQTPAGRGRRPHRRHRLVGRRRDDDRDRGRDGRAGRGRLRRRRRPQLHRGDGLRRQAPSTRCSAPSSRRARRPRSRSPPTGSRRTT